MCLITSLLPGGNSGTITVDWGDNTTSNSSQEGIIAVGKDAPYIQTGTYEVKVMSAGSYMPGTGYYEAEEGAWLVFV